MPSLFWGNFNEAPFCREQKYQDGFPRERPLMTFMKSLHWRGDWSGTWTRKVWRSSERPQKKEFCRKLGKVWWLLNLKYKEAKERSSGWSSKKKQYGGFQLRIQLWSSSGEFEQCNRREKLRGSDRGERRRGQPDDRRRCQLDNWRRWQPGSLVWSHNHQPELENCTGELRFVIQS